MERDKKYFYYFIAYYFIVLIKKNGCRSSLIHLRTYSEAALSVKTCKYWFRRWTEVEKVVLIWKTKRSAKKIQKYRIADNVNENSTW